MRTVIAVSKLFIKNVAWPIIFIRMMGAILATRFQITFLFITNLFPGEIVFIFLFRNTLFDYLKTDIASFSSIQFLILLKEKPENFCKPL